MEPAAVQMAITDWLLVITLGGVMGMIGQGIRMVVGIKKLQDRTEQYGEVFETSKLVLSLLIGFIAGALAALVLVQNTSVDTKVLMGLMAAGYAGTDFIEGFARKYLPGGKTAGAGKKAGAS